MKKIYTESDLNQAILTAFGAGFSAGESKKFKTPFDAWEALKRAMERKKRRMVQKV